MSKQLFKAQTEFLVGTTPFQDSVKGFWNTIEGSPDAIGPHSENPGTVNQELRSAFQKGKRNPKLVSGHSDPSLTPVGGRHMVLRKD